MDGLISVFVCPPPSPVLSWSQTIFTLWTCVGGSESMCGLALGPLLHGVRCVTPLCLSLPSAITSWAPINTPIISPTDCLETVGESHRGCLRARTVLPAPIVYPSGSVVGFDDIFLPLCLFILGWGVFLVALPMVPSPLTPIIRV